MKNWLRVDRRVIGGVKVRGMATACGLHPAFVVYGLMNVWMWFDDHSEDGWADGATVDLVNELGGHEDFGYAMAKAGLLTITPSGLKIPKAAPAVKRTASTREADRLRQATYRAKKRAGWVRKWK